MAVVAASVVVLVMPCGRLQWLPPVGLPRKPGQLCAQQLTSKKSAAGSGAAACPRKTAESVAVERPTWPRASWTALAEGLLQPPSSSTSRWSLVLLTSMPSLLVPLPPSSAASLQLPSSCLGHSLPDHSGHSFR